MIQHEVSEENLRKVERFFVEKAKEEGTKELQDTIVNISNGADVAVATAHRAIKKLEEKGILTIIKPVSRRFSRTYIYNGDISEFTEEENKDRQIVYLKSMIAKKDGIIQEKNKENDELKNELAKLKKSKVLFN